MHLRAQRAQLAGQRLGAPAAGMHDHQLGARRDVRGGIGDQLGGFLACLTGGFQHDDALVGEQRRAQQFGQLVDTDLTGPHPVDRDVVGTGALPRRPQHLRDSALDQQLLFSQDEMQRRNLLAHRSIVSRAPDRPAGPYHQTRQRPGNQPGDRHRQSRSKPSPPPQHHHQHRRRADHQRHRATRTAPAPWRRARRPPNARPAAATTVRDR